MPKQCPFCAEAIHSDAKKCKHCNEMLHSTPILTEQTSKRFKKGVVIGSALSILGVFVILLNGGNAGVAGIGLLMVASGLITFLSARILAWWHHG